MSRQEADREDLLREATALVERVELVLPGCEEPVTIGFRRDGSASFFFGADPVYQFNSAGELRRAFAGGRLIKADRGCLVSLDRRRTQNQVALVRLELDATQSAELLTDVARRLAELIAVLDCGAYTIVGQVPPDAKVAERISIWLAAHRSPIRIAQSPHAR